VPHFILSLCCRNNADPFDQYQDPNSKEQLMATPKRKAKKTSSKRSPRTRQSPRRSGAQAVQQISPCLWFDSQAEEAAKFYVSVFKRGKIVTINRYPAVGQEIHRRPPGSVMTVDFVINGLHFTALNGGPIFKFNEAVSLQVLCKTQKEIDYYWEKLGDGGDPNARQCGWLKDKFGLSWQVAPTGMAQMFKNPGSKNTERAFAAMMQMKKLDIAALHAAYNGKG
jgi:predicted 3-demethylubiquinone-9 3-methyltransferase (glyoxalase superfamily)